MTNRIDEIRARVASLSWPDAKSVNDVLLLLAEVDRLTAERDEYRSKLMGLAVATEISGLSWNGFNIIGDKKSVKAVQTAVHYAGQIEQYRAAFDERIATLAAVREQERERCSKIAESRSLLWKKTTTITTTIVTL